MRQIHDRILTIARDEGVIAGRHMRVDTTVVETNIHVAEGRSARAELSRLMLK
jgi:IS5 family transposase